MRNDQHRIASWWAGLSDNQRVEALEIDCYLSEWMVTSLANAGVDVHRERTGNQNRTVDRFLIPRALTHFVGQQATARTPLVSSIVR